MSVEDNLETSEKYHELNSENMDEILTPDFLGQGLGSDFKWNLEKHKEYWSKNKNTMEDTIQEQFGAGDKVCTRFIRKGIWKGKNVTVDFLHLKTFRDGKIAHIWESANPKQFE